MNLPEFRMEIESFKNDVLTYRSLLQQVFAKVLPYSTEKAEHIHSLRSKLSSTYGRNISLIKKLGTDPHMSYGVPRIDYSVYHNGFSEDIQSRVLPSLGAVIQDLDFIFGKVSNISEDEFKNLTEPSKIASNNETTFWHKSNPFWLMYQLYYFARKHKIWSTIIGLLFTFAITDYSLAWKNINNFISLIISLF